jgi:ATP-dependent RNA helicase DeaD
VIATPSRPARPTRPDADRPARPRRGLARVFVSAGREMGVSRRDLVAAIESEIGLGPRDLGAITVAERFSLVEVPGELVEDVVERLDGVRIRGRKVTVRPDRAPARMG